VAFAWPRVPSKPPAMSWRRSRRDVPSSHRDPLGHSGRPSARPHGVRKGRRL